MQGRVPPRDLWSGLPYPTARGRVPSVPGRFKAERDVSDHLDQGCICNVDLPVGTSKEQYETGEINFNVIFYLTQYAKYFKIESIFYFFFLFIFESYCVLYTNY